MILHIDGDNIPYRSWGRLVRIFRSKYPSISIMLYRTDRLSKVEQHITSTLAIPVTLVNGVYKEAVDVTIIFTTVSLVHKHHFIVSNDKGFLTLPQLTNNVSVLNCSTHLFSNSKVDILLRSIFQQRQFMLASTVGQHVNCKLHGYSTLKQLVAASNDFMFKGEYVISKF